MAGRQRIRKRDTWRERMIRTVAGILEQGEPSKFRFEAECRHSIRHDLCLEGVLWAEADQRAASVVTAALDRLKAVRPTWWEAQLEYAENYQRDRSHCDGCGAQFFIGDGTFGRGRFCEACQQKAAAYKAVSFARHAEWRVCTQCGGNFETAEVGQSLCSRRCQVLAMTIHHEKPCEVCGTVFKPESLGHGVVNRFCSVACGNRARTLKRPEIACPICCSIFRPKRPKGRFCSPDCARVYARRALAAKNAEPAAEIEEPIRRAAE